MMPVLKPLLAGKIPLLVLACLLPFSALSAAKLRRPDLGEEILRPQGDMRAFQQHLEALTAEDMAGRGTGSPGGMRAIAYLERQMRLAGLKGLPGLIREYRQEFSLADPRPIEFNLLATGLSWMDSSGEISSRQDAAVPFCFSPDADIERQLVFVGYGLKIPELGIDEYAGLDVRGKIVLVLRGAPGRAWRSSRFKGKGEALKFSSKMGTALAAGAAGFLLVGESAGLDEEQEDALVRRALRARGESTLPALWITRGLAEELLACSGQSLAQRQAGIDLQLEAIASQARKSKAEAQYRGLIPELRCRLRVSMAGPRPDLQTANLVGLLRGVDPQLRNEFIVIGAHHDHLGRGAFGSMARDAVGQVHPGADDNASGVAALLLLAEYLSAEEQPGTRRSLLFVAFGAEELGMHGSKQFLADCPVPRAKIAAMINLDMIGRAGADRLRIEGVASGLGLRDLVRSISDDCQRRVRLRERASSRSDHWNFLQSGIPALFVNSGIHEQYHRPSDVLELIELGPALETVDLVAKLIVRLADLQQAPKFSPDGLSKSFLRSGDKKK